MCPSRGGKDSECYNPTGEGRDSLFSYPTGGGKDSVYSNPTGGEKDSLFSHPNGGERDSLCSPFVGETPYVQSYGVFIKDQVLNQSNPSSGKQAKIVPASMKNLRCTPLNSKPHRGRIQTTLQGVPDLLQDSMHSQRLHRLQKTKCLVNFYSRLAM